MSDMQMTPPLKKWRRTKQPFDESEGESQKVGLKLNIQKMKIMASGHITLWEIDGETVSNFSFLGSKITVDGDFSHEVGGGFMFGNACTPVVDSCQCMAKPIQYCKVK